MKIRPSSFETNDGETIEGFEVDKEKYDIITVTEDMVGQKIRIPRRPIFFTKEQMEAIQKVEL